MKRRSRSARPRQKVDWVVNDDAYTLNNFACGVGILLSIPLTYPAGYRASEMGAAFLAADRQMWSAFPEGSNQRTIAVRGHILTAPSAWAAGQLRNLIFRITALPMDYTGGGAVVDTTYSLRSARHANEHYCWQEIVYDTFVAGTETRNALRVNASCKRRLGATEGLFLMIQNLGTASENIELKLRTLVSAY